MITIINHVIIVIIKMSGHKIMICKVRVFLSFKIFNQNYIIFFKCVSGLNFKILENQNKNKNYIIFPKYIYIYILRRCLDFEEDSWISSSASNLNSNSFLLWFSYYGWLVNKFNSSIGNNGEHLKIKHNNKRDQILHKNIYDIISKMICNIIF